MWAGTGTLSLLTGTLSTLISKGFQYSTCILPSSLRTTYDNNKNISLVQDIRILNTLAGLDHHCVRDRLGAG